MGMWFNLSRTVKATLSSLLIPTCFLFPYCIGWRWKFEVATGLLLIMCRWKWREDWRNQTGLNLHLLEFLSCALVCFVIYQLGAHAITYLMSQTNIQLFVFQDWAWR